MHLTSAFKLNLNPKRKRLRGEKTFRIRGETRRVENNKSRRTKRR